MDKKEMAVKLLNLIQFNDMLDMEIKKVTDGKPSFCDMDDYQESKNILQKAAIGILRENKDQCTLTITELSNE